ncbi:uncharacterized protein FIBRA_07293 [Fibroporia radiculosa]|uniref:Protein root UVB sensitive/RUS domain-containing protein n=1 Tax=Fibroporia radiculosa TaxID=599839 RepID=J4IBQ8_9APHY|nr:uncharacterized protein FIBRA_07293 [Fibroporia radiculosa]CCM05086.1 predicted protein [Fibroporia radiculosa]
MSHISIAERDDSGRLLATYLCAAGEHTRSDTPSFSIKQKRTDWRRLLSNVFLPAGYPASVSPDYLQYQIYNALQAFCSSLASLIASRAVLEGHGVGNADASATHAIFLTVLQDIFSRLTTIVSGYYLGTSLFPEAKTYRLLADIFNDAAIVLDTLSPHLDGVVLSLRYPFVLSGSGSSLRVSALCLSGASRALCGMVAGGSKAALTVHFASPGQGTGDVGDLNAKDGSKETVLALLGMLSGTAVMHYVHSARATYLVLFVLTFLHLFGNYLAVRVVVLRSLNRQRANIVWMAYRAHIKGPMGGKRPLVLTPEAVAARERIFANPSALHDTSSPAHPFLGICKVGSSFSSLASRQQSAPRGALAAPSPPQIHTILEIFSEEPYVLWFGPTSGPSCRLHVFLKDGHKPRDHLKAWTHAQEAAIMLNGRQPGSFEVALAAVQTSYALVEDLFPPFLDAVRGVGWRIDEGGILAGSPRTISVKVHDMSADSVSVFEDKKTI